MDSAASSAATVRAGTASDSTQVENGFPNGHSSAEKCERGAGKQQKVMVRVIRNFTPTWFSVNMGTGIVSILLYNLPYNGIWLYWISVGIFCLNVFLFLIFFLITTFRYALYPELWPAMLRHPTQSLFLGTFPMGLATIISMIAYVCVPAWGYWASMLAWTLWWIDAAISLAICCYLPFAIMVFHQTEFRTITAAWLLPIVSTIVASATGGTVAEVLDNHQHAVWTVVVSYFLWGTGVPLAMVVLVIYFQRLTIHKLPPKEVIVSVFLPLGPLGQGAFSIMQLGRMAMKLFPTTNMLPAGKFQSGAMLYVLGWVVGIIMWGYGIVWLFLAIASITRHKFPFNMGWWGFTFPLGVYAVATVTLGKETPSMFFDILGTIFSLSVVLLWLMVFILTMKKAATGELFLAPCLKNLNPDDKKPEEKV